VVTHPKIYRPPTLLGDAIQQVEYWMESPTLRLLGEGPGYWDHLRLLLETGKTIGPMVHDARVAAICRSSGVREIWSADRDYTSFRGLAIRNPLVEG
jgi:predicted nucleic acid-binding protein